MNNALVKNISKKPLINKLLEDFSYRKQFNQRDFLLDILDLFEDEISNQKISQAEIAQVLGLSASRISQILNGKDKNLTTNTIADIASALNKKFELTLIDDRHSPVYENEVNEVIRIEKICSLKNLSTYVQFHELDYSDYESLLEFKLPSLENVMGTQEEKDGTQSCPA